MTAVFAADAVARLKRSVGVVAVTAGPGLTNTVTAIKNAQMAESPVVLLGGAAATLLKVRHTILHIALISCITRNLSFRVAELCKISTKWPCSDRYVNTLQRFIELLTLVQYLAKPFRPLNQALQVISLYDRFFAKFKLKGFLQALFLWSFPSTLYILIMWSKRSWVKRQRPKIFVKKWSISIWNGIFVAFSVGRGWIKILLHWNPKCLCLQSNKVRRKFSQLTFILASSNFLIISSYWMFGANKQSWTASACVWQSGC